MIDLYYKNINKTLVYYIQHRLYYKLLIYRHIKIAVFSLIVILVIFYIFE